MGGPPRFGTPSPFPPRDPRIERDSQRVFDFPVSPGRAVSMRFPAEPLSEDEWAVMIDVLEAMRPGLVKDDPIRSVVLVPGTPAAELAAGAVNLYAEDRIGPGNEGYDDAHRLYLDLSADPYQRSAGKP